MKIEVSINEAYTEPKIVICTDKMTEEINAIIQKLSSHPPSIITGFRDEKAEILEPSQIIRIYSENGKVYAQTAEGTYRLRLCLYEIEERLDKTFVRISNSEIISLKKVKGFDLSFSGTICVTLTGDIVTYVSRRYVRKIKQVLGI